MNLRTLIVKGLYPVCSDEVQILLDQMREHPEKFTDLFTSVPYRTSGNPWFEALNGGGFELVDHVALRQQLKLLKTAYAKQLILQGLMEAKEIEGNRETTLKMFSPLVSNTTTGRTSLHAQNSLNQQAVQQMAQKQQAYLNVTAAKDKYRI